MNTAATVNSPILTTGTSQTDLLLLQCLRNSVLDLRKNNIYELNYVFGDLLFTDILVSKYGANELSKIKRWFSTYELPVIYGSFLWNKVPPPLVAVKLLSSDENEGLKGFGDENAVVSGIEDIETLSNQSVSLQPTFLSGPFTPLNYNITTGVMTVSSSVVVFPGELVQTQSGNQYPIYSITASNQLSLTTGIMDNFTNAVITYPNPNPYTDYYFDFTDELYEITCVTTNGEASLFWITSIIKYILFKNRKDWFEKYNLGMSSIKMSASELLETEGTNVQYLYQKILFKCRVENRIFKGYSFPIRGIQGTVGLQSISDVNAEITTSINF